MTLHVKIEFLDGEIWEKENAIRVQRDVGTYGVQTRRKDNSAGPAWTEFPLINIKKIEVEGKARKLPPEGSAARLS